jgi:hypothetical protein
MIAELTELLKKIDEKFTFDERLNKLAEECSEFIPAYFHYKERGEEYLQPMIEEIIGIDLTLVTVRNKIFKDPDSALLYKKMLREQVNKCEIQIRAEDLLHG